MSIEHNHTGGYPFITDLQHQFSLTCPLCCLLFNAEALLVAAEKVMDRHGKDKTTWHSKQELQDIIDRIRGKNEQRDYMV